MAEVNANTIGSFTLNNFKGRIVASLLVMGLVTIALVSYNQWMIGKLNNERIELLDVTLPANQGIQELMMNTHKSAYLLAAYVESGDRNYHREWQQTWALGLQEVIDEIQVLSEVLKDEQAEKLSRQVGIRLNNLHQTQNNIIRSVDKDLKAKGFFREDVAFESEAFYGASNNVYVASSDPSLLAKQQHLNGLVAGEIGKMVAELSSESGALQSYFDSALTANLSRIDAKFRNFRHVSWGMIALSAVVGVILGFWLILYILKYIVEIRQSVRALSAGNIPALIEENSNETNLIVRKLNHLSSQLRNVKKLAEYVGERHFDENIAAFEASSELGSSLASMRESLRSVAEEDRRRLWVNEGYGHVANLLRENNDNLQNLCDEVLNRVVKYLDINQGALLLLNNDDEANPIMEVKSLYAYSRLKFNQSTVSYGHGLLGQVWRDKSPIYLTEIPDNFVNIKSGLGTAEPSCLFIAPMMANEEVVGLIELASFREIEVHEKEFIHRVCDAIATAVGNVRMNERTISLLQESQERAEEMRAQEEEMRQNMEELKSTQEEMFRTQKEVAEKEYNLNALINNTADSIFAMDTNYCITVINKVLRDKYLKLGITLDIGKNILEVLSGEARTLWKDRYDRALAGDRFDIIEERKDNAGKTVFVQMYHNPIYNDLGSVIGVSVITREVTELVLARKEAQQKEITLNALINSTDDTYFAVDTQYQILVANETLRERFRSGGIELREGDNILNILPEDQRVRWKERYDRIFAGEKFYLEEERRVKNKVLFVEVHCIPISNDVGEVKGAMVVSKDITGVRKALEEKKERDQEIDKLRQQIGLNTSEPSLSNGGSFSKVKADVTNPSD